MSNSQYAMSNFQVLMRQPQPLNGTRPRNIQSPLITFQAMSKKIVYLLTAGLLLLAQTPALPIQRLPVNFAAERHANVLPKAQRAAGKIRVKGIFKLARFVKKHAGRFLPHSSQRSG